MEDLFKKIISHCKEYGFIFPSSEIYDGLSAVYDYGQIGTLLKNNLRDYWWRSMTQINENIVGIDSAIFMHPKIWKASGHVDAFHDPMIDNKDSKKRYRADELIEDYLSKINEKIEKEILKAQKKFGNSFNIDLFLQTNLKVKEYKEKYDSIKERLKQALNNNDLKELKNIIEEEKICCPVSGTCNWTDVRQFNLMFSTQLGPTSDEADLIYLRPETAQGIFVNFLNVYKTGRMKIPFGIAQVGKAFRNEIVARQFIFRMREFEQMEMQFFVKPGEEKKWFKYWKEQRMLWHKTFGLDDKFYRYHDHEKLAHYANAATDIEFLFPFGYKELEGIHSRTDFDLSSHQNYSGKKMSYFDPDTQESYIPYVIETSIGLDRLFLAIICGTYKEEKLEDGSIREILSLPDFIAPIQVAVFPLVKRDGMPEKALEIFEMLQPYFYTFYDEKDSIGRRYRRMDAIGTPYCITIDQETLTHNTVTIRNRDTMIQDRVAIDNIINYLQNKLCISNKLKIIQQNARMALQSL
ncbi:MAG: glycine--tRNA ligase [Bacteroidales bacterium]|nr:glycine--tRNA ligase [Bacteroidales bacterium]